MNIKFIAAGAAFCALGMTGCSNETDEPDAQTGKQVVMTMQTATDGPQTRADYTEDETDDTKMKFSWRSGDELSVVVDGVAGNENKKLTATADGKSAPFSGEVTSFEGSKTIYAFYPYSATPYAITDGDNKETATAALTLPNPQTYTVATGTTTTGAMTNSFMVGVGTATASGDAITASASLKQVMSIIKLNITNAPGKVTGVKLKCTDAVFATTATVKLSDASITNSSGLVNELSMTVTDNSIDNTATKAISFALFPKAKVDGKKIQIEVTYEGGESNTIEKDDIAFARNMHYVLSFDADELIEKTKWDGTYPTADDAYTYSGGEGTPDKPYQIATAKDLAQLTQNVSGGYDTSNNFILTKNINLNGHEWTPIGKTGKVFQGTFDGGGKVITGMKITKYDTSNNTYVGLFGYVNGGTIKNINVAGEVTINASSTRGIYAGGISGYCYDATLSGNLTNHVNITIVNADSGFLRIGGVTGSSNTNNDKAFANVTLVNDGTLSAEGPAEVNVGGVIGYVMTDIEQGTTLINSGAVSGTSSGKKCRVGGLIGFSNNAVTCNGTNTGSVKGQISGGMDAVCSGGFIGYANTTIKIDSSRNTGTIKAENKSTESTAHSYAGIRVGGSSTLKVIENVNKDADGNPGSTDGVTATATTGKSYVNGLETTPIP